MLKKLLVVWDRIDKIQEILLIILILERIRIDKIKKIEQHKDRLLNQWLVHHQLWRFKVEH